MRAARIGVCGSERQRGAAAVPLHAAAQAVPHNAAPALPHPPTRHGERPPLTARVLCQLGQRVGQIGGEGAVDLRGVGERRDGWVGGWAGLGWGRLQWGSTLCGGARLVPLSWRCMRWWQSATAVCTRCQPRPPPPPPPPPTHTHTHTHTCGSSSLRLISMTWSYSAPSSARRFSLQGGGGGGGHRWGRRENACVAAQPCSNRAPLSRAASFGCRHQRHHLLLPPVMP